MRASPIFAEASEITGPKKRASPELRSEEQIMHTLGIARRTTAMNLPRRQFLRLAVGAAALPAASRIARAGTYPSRPVHIIIGNPPGGPTDTLARIVGQWLSERLCSQVFIR